MSLHIVAPRPVGVHEDSPSLLRTITPAGGAWLRAFDLARLLGFTDSTAQAQAFAAADRVNED